MKVLSEVLKESRYLEALPKTRKQEAEGKGKSNEELSFVTRS